MKYATALWDLIAHSASIHVVGVSLLLCLPLVLVIKWASGLAQRWMRTREVRTGWSESDEIYRKFPEHGAVSRFGALVAFLGWVALLTSLAIAVLNGLRVLADRYSWSGIGNGVGIVLLLGVVVGGVGFVLFFSFRFLRWIIKDIGQGPSRR